MQNIQDQKKTKDAAIGSNLQVQKNSSSRDLQEKQEETPQVQKFKGETNQTQIYPELMSASSWEVNLDDENEQFDPISGQKIDPFTGQPKYPDEVPPKRNVTMVNIPWTYTKQFSSEEAICFDDIQCINLEYHYQFYHEADEATKPQYRYVQVDPYTVIDLYLMQEKKEPPNDNGVITVQRIVNSPTFKRKRPNSVYQIDFCKSGAQINTEAPGHNILQYDFNKFNWLGEKWFSENGSARYPSRNQLVNGVIEADRVEISRLYAMQNPQQENMQLLFTQRAQAWKIFFEFSEINIRKNMDAPIDVSIIHYLPYHPLTATCIYLLQMETPIRYALNKATKTRDGAYVKSLGPLAFALKAIVMHTNVERDDQHHETFVCCNGSLMSQQMLVYYQESVKKEINLTGFTLCLTEEEAIEEAFKNQIQDKNPVLMKILIDCDYNYLMVDRLEYSPYHQTENQIILQDGLCLKVMGVQKTTVKRDGKVEPLVKISLKMLSSLK